MTEIKPGHVYGFEKLTVWQDARILVKQIYLLTKQFPVEERFSLTDQMRRAAISIISNIAEGSNRTSGKDRSHFYQISYSSLMEVLSQLVICLDLDYISEAEYSSLRIQIEKLSYLLNQLHKSAQVKATPPSKPSKPSQQ